MEGEKSAIAKEEPNVTPEEPLMVGKAPDGNDKELEIAQKSFPMRETVIGPLKFNAVTSLLGIIVLWGFSIYCMVDTEGSSETLQSWKTAVSKHFTWLYIGGNPCFTFFCMWLGYRYGDIKLGAKHEKPEFSNASYFALIFSAGVAAALFYYGVSEPLWLRNDSWFSNPGYKSQDEKDGWAMTLTAYHWGFAGWSPYVVMGISAGLASYRFGLPMTVRSALYPILGSYTWGWIGDIIDGFSIVTTVSGICTSLGVGAFQIVAGLKKLEWIDPDMDKDQEKVANMATIWFVTIIATISVVSGLNIGIKILSKVAFAVGMVLLTLVLMMDKTYHILNLIVQTLGMYFQWAIFLMPFWTDAYGQLGEGEGRATDGLASPTWFMDSWTTFYMAWWTAWSCFVGMFIARVSRGRTIREVIGYCFFAPLLYSILWFGVFGGVGLRQARQAEELSELGLNMHNDSGYFLAAGSEFCYDVPQEDITYMKPGATSATTIVNQLPGVTPVCAFDSSQATAAWYNVMYSFSYPGSGVNFGPFLAALSLFAATVYFVTSSDSGSLIVDYLASNGRMEHHWSQRVFWALTEGLTAFCLLLAGGDDALKALQAASIVFGLPFCVLLFLMCPAIVTMCAHAEENEESDTLEDSTDNRFGSGNTGNWQMPIFGGIFNIFEFLFSLGSVHPERIEMGMDRPTSFQAIGFFRNIFAPFIDLYKCYGLLDTSNSQTVPNILTTTVYGLSYYTCIVCFFLRPVNNGFTGLAYTLLFCNACILCSLRMTIREKFGINGNPMGDFFASAFTHQQVLLQIQLEFTKQSSSEMSAKGEDLKLIE